MDNLNTITYDDGWKQAYAPVYKDDEAVHSEEEPNEVIKIKKERQYGKSYLMIVQLILCLIIILTAFGLKALGGDLYKNIRSWYYENLNDEIILTDSFNSFDLDNIFNNNEN